MAVSLTLRELAARLGVSPSSVSRAIMTGRIPSECVVRDDAGRPRVVRVRRALVAWRANRNVALTRMPATSLSGSATSVLPRKTRASHTMRSQSESRAIEADYKARMAQLDYEERVRTLINAEWVEARVAQMCAAARNRLLGVPTKAKGLIPRLTVADVEQLEELIREALEALADGGWRDPV
jgi:DNA-binding Lrp family transcriptional regulator